MTMTHVSISDRVFVKNFAMLVAALMGISFVFFIVAQMVAAQVPTEDTVDMQAKKDALTERISPVGQLVVADSSGSAGGTTQVASVAVDGKATYDTACAVCHAAGVAGAPKLGDKAAWAPRIAQGTDTLYQHAISGFQGTVGFMPAKGGNASLADDAVKSAVDHMVKAAQ
jgi:cytochrome c5